MSTIFITGIAYTDVSAFIDEVLKNYGTVTRWLPSIDVMSHYVHMADARLLQVRITWHGYSVSCEIL
jgi:hypothetical protein